MCDPSRQENRPQNERDPNREREQKAREIIGGGTATLIWFFVDLTFVWPESHQRAYWFAVIFVGAQVIQIGRLRLRTMAITLGIWIVVAAIGYPFLPPTPRPETETHFWIQPGSQPMPSGLCNGQLTDKNLVVRFGSFAVTTTLNYYRALLIMGCTQVVLERTDRGLAVSTDIYDEGGNEIVEIDSNEVKRLPQNIIDRTPNGFLVKGPG